MSAPRTPFAGRELNDSERTVNNNNNNSNNNNNNNNNNNKTAKKTAKKTAATAATAPVTRAASAIAAQASAAPAPVPQELTVSLKSSRFFFSTALFQIAELQAQLEVETQRRIASEEALIAAEQARIAAEERLSTVSESESAVASMKAGASDQDTLLLLKHGVLDLQALEAERVAHVPPRLVALAKRLQTAVLDTLNALPAVREFRARADACAATTVPELALQLARESKLQTTLAVTQIQCHLESALVAMPGVFGGPNSCAVVPLASGVADCEVNENAGKPQLAVRVRVSDKRVCVLVRDRWRAVPFAVQALEQFLSLDALSTSHCFAQVVVDNKFTTFVLLPLAYRCFLRVQVNEVNLSCTSFGTRDMIDFLCSQLAVRTCIDSLRNNGAFVDLVGAAQVPRRDHTDVDEERHISTRLLLGADLDQVATVPAPFVAQFAMPGKSSTLALAAELAQPDIELIQFSRDVGEGTGVIVVQNAKHVFKLLCAHATSSSQRDGEQTIFQLLTRTCSDVIMPLVSTLVAPVPPHISSKVRMHGKGVAFVMERANGGHCAWKTMSGAVLAVRGEELLTAVARLHAVGVVHGDLKPGNLVVHDGTLRVIDFGSAALFDLFDETSAWVYPRGTRGFQAPETQDVRKCELTPAVDLFSVGCVFALTPAAETSAPLAALVTSLTAWDPSERPSAAQALTTWRTSVQLELSNQFD